MMQCLVVHSITRLWSLSDGWQCVCVCVCVLCAFVCVCVCVCFYHCSKSHSKQRRLKFNFGAWKLPKVGKKKKNGEDILDKGKLPCMVAGCSRGSFLALSKAVLVCVGQASFRSERQLVLSC